MAGHARFGVDTAEVELVLALLEVEDDVERDRPVLARNLHAVDLADEDVGAVAAGQVVDAVAADQPVVAAAAVEVVGEAVTL